jgi:hypothetical protein
MINNQRFLKENELSRFGKFAAILIIILAVIPRDIAYELFA